ncbi:TlpA disulfide reductase family protein [Aromatoleum evansii]|uniref:TlpA disulfide reductase family protein n=1 Tax=Aromatoleum evansii TaxID=59406 RepID=A0ABZ1ANX3_AROEV|nr:TlpA disulfide reductase family protein [Aromatoleum evansii]
MMTRDSDRQPAGTPRTPASPGTHSHRILALLTAAALLTTPIAAAGSGDKPTAMPALQLTSLEGGAVRSQDWLNGRPAVVNLWATWCAPCRTEMPSLQRLAALLAPEGIRVLALSVDTDHNLVREFVLKYGISMPVSIANSPSQAMAALGVVALPHTLYVGGDGRILGSHLGQRDWADPAVVREVRDRLGTKVPARH